MKSWSFPGLVTLRNLCRGLFKLKSQLLGHCVPFIPKKLKYSLGQ